MGSAATIRANFHPTAQSTHENFPDAIAPTMHINLDLVIHDLAISMSSVISWDAFARSLLVR